MIFGSETETIEFKKTTGDLRASMRDISAILNKHGGGELYFGIRPDGLVVGQAVTEKSLHNISQDISNFIEPNIFPTIDKVVIDGKTCIRVVFEGGDAPYFANGRAHIRVSDESILMNPKELQNYILKKHATASTWDQIVSDIEIPDIREDILKAYIERANKSGRISWEYSNLADVLSKLNLLVDGRPRNAARAMFGKNPRLEIQMAIFATKEKLTFNDIRREQGTIIELVDLAELYIKNNIRYRVEFTDRMQRTEIPEIPIIAVREALLNSYAHKSFNVHQINEVAIYSDRVEIYNPGIFPEGLSPEDFLDGSGKSVHRNPLLAEIMYYSKDIEGFGTGFARIVAACDKADVRYEFKKLKMGFSVVFYRPVFEVADKTTGGATRNAMEMSEDSSGASEDLDGMSEDSNGVSEDLGEMSEDLVDVSEDSGEVSEDLSKKDWRTRAILSYLASNEYLTPKITESLLGVASPTVRRHLKHMVDLQLIVPRGETTSRKYYLK